MPKSAPYGWKLIATLVCSTLAACADSKRRDDAVLVAAIPADPGHLNPAITTNGGVHTASSTLYNGLLSLGEDLQPAPELAESWQVLDGGRRYRFQLRNDVSWHDGRRFTAADVVFSFREVLLKYHARTRASLGAALQSIEAPDSFTVEFRFAKPYAPLLQQLDVVEAPIVPKHVFEGADPLRHPANSAPVGTGPFRFVSRRADEEFRFTANDAYFGGAPRVRELVLRVIPDLGMQVVALEAGEVDWIFNVPGPERARLTRDRRFHLIQTALNPGGSNCITTFGFNLDRPLLKDARVRRAIAHATDRRQFLDRIAFGEGRVATAPISSRISFAHAGAISLAGYDTVAANELLERAGWIRQPGSWQRRARGVPGYEDGSPLVLSFKGLPLQRQYGDLWRAQLRPLGIDLRTETLEQGTFSQAVFAQRDFDTAIASYCNGTDPEIGVRRMYTSANIAPVPFSNMAGYRNAAVDSLFDLAASTLDKEARRRYYHAIQEIVARDQPYIWLLESEATRAHSSRCRNFGPSAHFAVTAVCGG